MLRRDPLGVCPSEPPAVGMPMGNPREYRTPVRMSEAAFLIRSGVTRFKVPIWSSSPHLPQLLCSLGTAPGTLPSSPTVYVGGCQPLKGTSLYRLGISAPPYKSFDCRTSRRLRP